jgi:hypothetical protein
VQKQCNTIRQDRIRKEFFTVRVVETWNRLPDRVKLTEKPESFKKELKQIIMASTQKERIEKRRKARKIIPCMLYRQQIRIYQPNTGGKPAERNTALIQTI